MAVVTLNASTLTFTVRVLDCVWDQIVAGGLVVRLSLGEILSGALASQRRYCLAD
jgi:hypothetical protein